MRKFYKNIPGFSMLEITIVIAIFSVLMIIWTSFLIKGMGTFSFGFKQSEAVRGIEKSIETMVKEIRNAQMGDDGSYIMETAGDLTLTFYSDIDKDGAVERVRYFIENEEFKKGIIEPTGDPIQYNDSEAVITLARNIKNNSIPIFYYYDGSGNILPTEAILTDTKMIKVKLEIDVARPQNYILESYTQIRNLKDNL